MTAIARDQTNKAKAAIENASRSKLHAQAVTFVADVFQTGRFIGREELAHVLDGISV